MDRRSRLWNRPFLSGVVCGALLLPLAGLAINNTTLADRLVAPLLLNDSAADADAIVVLGGAVIGDCGLNVNSLRRTIHGARQFRDRRAPLMVLSGGAASDGCPVAAAMMAFAGELGVPDAKMFVESTSRTTRENAERTAPLLRAQQVARILLVTDRLHMRRAKGAFEHYGFTVEPISVPVYEGHHDNVDMLASGAREAAALAYYKVRGWTEARAVDGDGSMPPATEAAVRRSEVAYPDGPLVILGASYAGNWPLTEAGGVAVINNGKAGQRTFQFAERFDRDVIAHKPRAVLLWGFINNLFSSDNIDDAAAAVRADYTRMIAMAKAAHIEPILATEITARRHEGLVDYGMAILGRIRGKVSYHDRVNQYVMTTNQWLRDVGRKEGLLVLDFQQALADETGRRRLQFAAEDGSHVTPAGYDTLSKFVRPILARHFAPTAPPQ